MQEEKNIRFCSRHNGNYQVYFELTERHHLDTILLSKLDDSVFTCRLTSDAMPEQCSNLFQNIQGLYQFLEENGGNPDKTSFNDVGTVNITESIPNKSKIIKVNCAFQTIRVADPEEVTRFYIRIIKMLESRPRSEPEVPTPKHSSSSNLVPAKNTIIRHLQFTKRQLSVDMDNNPFLKSFSKQRDGIKIQDFVHKRIKLYFNEVIPRDQCVYFTIRIVNTKAGNFGFGVIDKKEKRDDKSFYSICYDFNNGELKDSNFMREAAQCRWRKVGPVLGDIRRAVLKLEINMKDRRIGFYCNNIWVCETVLTDYLCERDLVPYISVKHQGDEFLLNDE